MKKQLLYLACLTAVVVVAGSGCAVNSHRAWVREPATASYPSGEIVVTEQPPAPRREEVGVAPDTLHVWVEGYWTYANRTWVWIPGHWELRPRPDAVWVPGHWDKNPDGRGWTRVLGHWE